jgi:hypothetical protein
LGQVWREIQTKSSEDFNLSHLVRIQAIAAQVHIRSFHDASQSSA